jgi:soluble lytic murein transglycosylase-like protein
VKLSGILAGVLAATAIEAGQGISGSFILRSPDGSKRVINVPAAQRTGASVPAGSEERRARLWPVVEETARAHAIDPQLVDLVIRMESGYNERAVSPKGARGVMQLLPTTASLYGVRDLFDPLQNIRAGVQYLRDLIGRFGFDVALALAAYNAGPEAVDRYGGIPPYDETRTYVRTILDAYGGAPAAKLSGGFGRPARPAAPVTLSSDAGRTVISNTPRANGAPIARPLSLR